MDFESRREQFREKVISNFDKTVTNYYKQTKSQQDLLTFETGILVLMGGNLFSVVFFYSLAKAPFLIFSILTMFSLGGLIWSADKKGKVSEGYYLATTIITYIYGFVLFAFSDNTKGVYMFGLVYPVLSVFILKPFWGNFLIMAELVTSLVTNQLLNPLKMNDEMIPIYVVVYFMFWVISNIIEKVTNYQRQKMAEQQEQLSFMANYDQLTKLANRRRFYEKADEITNESVAIIMMDIDNFKKINDTYGHSFGDDVLKETASRISKTVRASDISCRWGGEEFLILANVDSEPSSVIFAQKVCDAIGKTIYFEGKEQPLNVTVSVGVVYVDNLDKIGLGNAIEQADENLYSAKRNGKNQVVGSLCLVKGKKE